MFENFEKFNSIDSNNHRERYNRFIINHISEKFKEYGWMWNKFEIEKIRVLLELRKNWL